MYLFDNQPTEQMSLRPYQWDAVRAGSRAFSEFGKILYVIPTGGGKTIIFAHHAKRFESKRRERTLIYCHRDELINQAQEKIQRSTGLWTSIEKADQHADRDAPVVVASIGSMKGKRLASWNREHFGLVVADEAHHAIADTWQAALAHFHDRAKVLGVTATPIRGDRKELSTYFENVPYEIGMLDLIRQGYLANVIIKALPIRIDMKGVRRKKGDYDVNDLSAVIEPMLRDVVEQMMEHARGRRTVVFLPLVKTSKLFVNICIEYGLMAAHVDGSPELDKERRIVLEAFESGEIDIISNSQLLREGWDCPPCDCVVWLCPTQSPATYAQGIGRGTRLFPGKENLLLLDFLFLHERGSLMRPADLIAATDEDADVMNRLLAGNASSKEAVDLIELRDVVAHQREQAMAAAAARQAKREMRMMNLVDVDSVIIDDTAQRGIFTKPPSEKQLDFLAKNKINLTQVRDFAHAQRLVRSVMWRRKEGMASHSQMTRLQERGIDIPTDLTYAKASEMLMELAGFKAGYHNA